jgi:hypothetical protein
MAAADVPCPIPAAPVAIKLIFGNTGGKLKVKN